MLEADRYRRAETPVPVVVVGGWWFWPGVLARKLTSLFSTEQRRDDLRKTCSIGVVFFAQAHAFGTSHMRTLLRGGTKLQQKRALKRLGSNRGPQHGKLPS